MQGGRIVSPDLAAAAVRGLLNRMRVSTRETVLGIAARAVMARVVEVPRVPENELPVLIAGEMEHYHLLHDNNGVFNYTILAGGPGSASGTLSVLLMAAEEQMLSGYREFAQQAGLKVVALEPILLAMYRAGYPRIQNEPFTTSLMVGSDGSEIALVIDGEIGLYRRISVGSDDLIKGRKAAHGATNAPLSTPGEAPSVAPLLVTPDEPEPVYESRANAYAMDDDLDEDYTRFDPIPPPDRYAALDVMSARSLATDLERSLDYYRRENPQSGSVQHILLTTDDPDLDLLPQWLSETLSLGVSLTPLPTCTGQAATLDPRDSYRFMGAAGLAMRNLPGHPADLPRFDLTRRRKQAAPHILIIQRKVALSLAATIVIAAFGIGTAMPLDARVTTLEHLVSSDKQSLASKQSQIQERLHTQVSHQEELDALRAQTIPFAPIVDAVVGAMDPTSRISSISLEVGGKIMVLGEAPNEPSIVNSLNGLRASPFFDHPTLDSYHLSAAPGTPGATMQFQVSAPLAGSLAPVSAPASPAASPPAH
jgi:Tfp pilus assembly PilM family ATPase